MGLVNRNARDPVKRSLFASFSSEKEVLSGALMRRSKICWTGEWGFDKRAQPRGILWKEGLMKSFVVSPFGMPVRAAENLAPGVGIYVA